MLIGIGKQKSKATFEASNLNDKIDLCLDYL